MMYKKHHRSMSDFLFVDFNIVTGSIQSQENLYLKD